MLRVCLLSDTPLSYLDITCAFSLCLDLGLGALKVPKEADEGGRATGSTRKGKRQHSSPQNPLLDCSLCGKVFSSASSLSKHYLTHSQERKHVCKVCSKAFKRQDHLYVKRLARSRAGGMHLSFPTLLSTHLSSVEFPLLCPSDVCPCPPVWTLFSSHCYCLGQSLYRASTFTPVRKSLPLFAGVTLVVYKCDEMPGMMAH